MASVLVVDDDPGVRELIARALQLDGHIVHCAAEGAEGLRALDAQNVDVIILDVFMPTKDGLETLRELRTRHARPKVIAISAEGRGGRFDPLAVAEKLGADAALEKPFNIDELMRSVRRCVE